ncbi:MAG: hypothetical protein ACYSR9_04365 [Planctomycetota bacterium]
MRSATGKAIGTNIATGTSPEDLIDIDLTNNFAQKGTLPAASTFLKIKDFTVDTIMAINITSMVYTSIYREGIDPLTDIISGVDTGSDIKLKTMMIA